MESGSNLVQSRRLKPQAQAGADADGVIAGDDGGGDAAVEGGAAGVDGVGVDYVAAAGAAGAVGDVDADVGVDDGAAAAAAPDDDDGGGADDGDAGLPAQTDR